MYFYVTENDLQSWLFLQSEHSRRIVSRGWLKEFPSFALDDHQTEVSKYKELPSS